MGYEPLAGKRCVEGQENHNRFMLAKVVARLLTDAKKRNEIGMGANWQFITQGARGKLKKSCPTRQCLLRSGLLSFGKSFSAGDSDTCETVL